MGLEQHVNFSTHTGRTTSDLVIVEIDNGIKVVKCEQEPYMSDHCVVKVKKRKHSKSVGFQNWKNIDKVEFSSDLASLSIDCEAVDDFVSVFESEIEKVIDKHASFKVLKQTFQSIKYINSENPDPKTYSTENWKKFKQPHNIRHSRRHVIISEIMRLVVRNV